jgi:hypothetical protein
MCTHDPHVPLPRLVRAVGTELGAHGLVDLGGDAVALVVAQVGPHALHRTEHGQQLRSGLLADAVHAGQVVGGVSAQSRVVQVLVRRDADHGLDPARGQQRGRVDAAVDHPQDRAVFADVGERVPVAGHDHGVPAGGDAVGGRLSGDVVGLEARDRPDREPGVGEHLRGELELGDQVGVLLAAGAPVLGVQPPAHLVAGGVEPDHESVGLYPVHSGVQHVQHALEGPRWGARTVAEASAGQRGRRGAAGCFRRQPSGWVSSWSAPWARPRVPGLDERLPSRGCHSSSGLVLDPGTQVSGDQFGRSLEAVPLAVPGCGHAVPTIGVQPEAGKGSPALVADQAAGLFLEHAVTAVAVGVAETPAGQSASVRACSATVAGAMEASRCADFSGGLAGMAEGYGSPTPT